MTNRSDNFLDEVLVYYEEKYRQFGPTSKGVDWKDKASQWLRFQQLAKLLGHAEEASILDFGCGYGAFYEYLEQHHPGMRYYGHDISPLMLQGAAAQFPDITADTWVPEFDAKTQFDYVIASGVFNVRLKQSDADWTSYIEDTLGTMNRLATRGFAFNMLTLYSDIEKRAAHLHFADPLHYFDLCKRHYAPYVTLIHDYPLYEFTLLVRREPP